VTRIAFWLLPLLLAAGLPAQAAGECLTRGTGDLGGIQQFIQKDSSRYHGHDRFQIKIHGRS